MFENIKLGQYLHGDSWYYRLDPRNKLIMTTLYIIFIFFANNWQGYLAIALFTFIIVLTSGIKLKYFYRSIRPIFFIMAFTFVINLFFIRTGEVLTTIPLIKVFPSTYNYQLISLIGFGVITILLIVLSILKVMSGKLAFRIFKYLLLLGLIFNVGLIFVVEEKTVWEWTLVLHKDAVINGGFIILRLILIVCMSSLLTFTTKPTDLTLAIERVLAPFKLVKLPVSEIAILISIALRFIPTLLEETQKIIKAQTSRGADFSEGNIKDKVVQIISLLIPMFIISFKRAEDLAFAMDARGYVPGKKRTSFRVLQWHYRDSLYVLSFVVLVAVIFNFRFGWL